VCWVRHLGRECADASSVGGDIENRVVHLQDLLDQRSEHHETWSTGLAELDRLTGGFALSQLWVITGIPGAGRSTLLTQFVYQLAANHRFSTDFHSARRESADVIGARFRALAGQSRSSETNLKVWLGGGWFTRPTWPEASRQVLAIDEPEFNRPPVLGPEGLDELRRCADRPAIVLVSVPWNHCFEAVPAERLRGEWASVADVMVEINPITEPGAAELRVIRNRCGPTGTVDTALDHHRARFVQR
jgi:replicative DNA helicase